MFGIWPNFALKVIVLFNFLGASLKHVYFTLIKSAYNSRLSFFGHKNQKKEKRLKLQDYLISELFFHILFFQNKPLQSENLPDLKVQ
jgi:hypothetical protein